MPTLSGQAPAKVNLGLKILNRRPDGYQEIRTIFQTISLSDRLTVSYNPRAPSDVSLDCSDAELQGSHNLAARAAVRLLQAQGGKGAVKIRLDKKIPVGAGLGGGSSDAAGVLLALRRLLKPKPPLALLFEVAAGLGSDVPYFLVGGTALGVGRGEEVYPLPDRQREWLVLLTPELRIPTPEAYRSLRQSRPRALTAASKQLIINGFCAGVCLSLDREAQDLVGVRPSCFENDFEEIIFRRHPDLHKWKQCLLRLGASRAMMSGSGSALFGVFSSQKRALEARGALERFPGKIYVVRTLSRRSCRTLWKS